jgi:heat shock protein HtpX
MLLEDVRRRNRRRAYVLATFAAGNYWLVLSVVVGFLGWGMVYRINPDAVIDGRVIVGVSGLVGAIAAGSYVATRFSSVRRTTLRRIGAKPVTAGQAPRLENLMEELAIAAGMAPVSIAILDDPAPNSLTVGTRPSDTSVVVTTGLIELLSRDELEAVMAVQLCAIQRLDVALRTVVVACAGGAIAVYRSFRDDWKDPRSWLGIAATWPTMMAADQLRRAVYRGCDFGADEMALAMTRHPAALVSAMEKLLSDQRDVAVLDKDTGPLWFEPVPVGADRQAHLRRHSMTPGLDQRIARLHHVTTA